jgi:3-methyladenine DNA glycosylase AlkD
MTSVDKVLQQLEQMASPDARQGMARFGMAADQRLGVSVPDMRRLAKAIGRDHDLALALWATGVAEAQIVATMIADPGQMSEAQMDDWVKDIDSWDVCDQACMNLFEKTPYAWHKIHDWSKRDEEFVKRAGYALIACLAWHDKQAADERFVQLMPVIVQGATDDRNFVKKAVSWALRNVGKRNRHLNVVAIETAQEIQQIDAKPARWIARDALRELQGEAVQRRLAKAEGKA